MNTTRTGNPAFQDIAQEQRERIAMIVARIILVTGLLISLAILYVALVLREWQLSVLYGGNVFFLIVAYAGYREIRNKNFHRGILIIVGAIQLVIALLPILFSDLGILIGLIGFLMASLILNQTLAPADSRKLIPLAAFTALVTILLGFLPLSFRVPAPSVLISIIGIAAIIETAVLSTAMWTQFRTYNLQTKLIVAFISLLVLSLLITGGYSVFVNFNTQRAQASAELQDDMLVKRSNMVSFLEAIREDTIFLSQAEVLKNYINTVSSVTTPNIVTRSRTEVEREFRYFAENRLVYKEIVFLDEDGQEIFRIDTDRDGRASIIPQSELLTINDPVYFRNRLYFSLGFQLRPRELFISPLDLNVERGAIEVPHVPVIRLATPVIVNTQKKGLIFITVYAEKFLNELSASGASTFLVDSEGYYLYHPEEAKRWGQDLGTGITVGQDFSGLENSLFSGQIGSQTANGQLITYAPVTVPGETSPRWFVGSYLSVEDVTRPILNSVIIAITILISTMVGSVFVMNYIGRTITKPIEDLADTARKVTGGDLSVRAEVQTRDEVGTLARVFNNMTSQLRELIAGLETRVAERTTELEKEKLQSEKRARQFEAITKVGQAISRTQNLHELLPQISKVIHEQFGFYHIGIFLNDPANQVAVLSAANSEGGQKMLARGHRLKVGEQGIVGYVTGTGSPRIALDVGEDAVFFNNPDLPDTRSEMALPLTIGERIIGALDVQSLEQNAFTGEDVDVLSTLADQVSIAIENVRLFEQTNKALSESEAVSRQYLRESWRHISEGDLAGFRYTASGATPIESRMNGQGDKDESEKDTRSFIKIPIQLRGETIGTLRVHVPQTNELTREQLDLVRAVAERVALSVENARLFEETTRRAERERRVSDITTKIRSVNDPQQMIDTAIEELRQALGATHIEVVPQRLSDATDR